MGRIKQMNLIINDMKFYEQLANENKTKEEISRMINGYQLDQIQKLLKKAPKGFF
jgi:histidyl-tRNA synthetase